MVIIAKVVAIEATGTLVVVVAYWACPDGLDFTSPAEDIAWRKWLVALVSEPGCFVTDTFGASVLVVILICVLNTVLTVTVSCVMTAEAEVMTDTLIVATVWTSPIGITDTASAGIISMLNTSRYPVAVGWSVTVFNSWVTVSNPDRTSSLSASLVVLPAWFADTFTFLVAVGVGDAGSTVTSIWAITVVTGKMAVGLYVVTTVITSPPIVTDTSSVWVSRGSSGLLNAVCVFHTEDTARRNESLFVPSITPVTDWVTVGCVQATTLTSPVWVTFTVHRSLSTDGSCVGMKDTSIAIVICWAATVLAPLITLTNIGLTVIAGPVIVAGTDTELIEVRVLVTGVALLWEVSTWAGGTGMGTITFPDPTVRLLPVWLAHASCNSILFGVLDALFAVVVGWASTVFTVNITSAVILAAVRAEPVFVTGADSVVEVSV